MWNVSSKQPKKWRLFCLTWSSRKKPKAWKGMHHASSWASCNFPTNRMVSRLHLHLFSLHDLEVVSGFFDHFPMHKGMRFMNFTRKKWFWWAQRPRKTTPFTFVRIRIGPCYFSFQSNLYRVLTNVHLLTLRACPIKLFELLLVVSLATHLDAPAALSFEHKACFQWSSTARPATSSNGLGLHSTPGTARAQRVKQIWFGKSNK